MHWIKIYFQNQNAIRQNILSQQNADIRSNHSADSDVEKGEKEHSPPPPYEEKKKEEFDPWAIAAPEDTGKPWKGNFNFAGYKFTHLFKQCGYLVNR